MERQDAEFHPVSPRLPLPSRIQQYCAQRARLLELIAPAARAARIREPFSAQLRLNRTWYVSRAREEIEQLFGEELEAAGSRRARLLDALTVNTTFAAWSMLRDELHLDVAAATEVMAGTVGALLRTQASNESVRAAS